MCQRVQCRTCGKPTWSGCGLHIEQALAGVPVDERCQCGEEPIVFEPRVFEPAAPAPAPPSRSWLSKVLGR